MRRESGVKTGLLIPPFEQIVSYFSLEDQMESRLTKVPHDDRQMLSKKSLLLNSTVRRLRALRTEEAIRSYRRCRLTRLDCSVDAGLIQKILQEQKIEFGESEFLTWPFNCEFEALLVLTKTALRSQPF